MTDKNITAEIIADSLNEQGERLTTFVLAIPRIVLAEFNTHRMVSRNSASSRAIPFKTMVEKVRNNPFIPMRLQKDHSGMQGTEYLEGEELKAAKWAWLQARDRAVESAMVLHGDIPIENYSEEPVKLSVTKQLCNRLLEPFLYHTIIATASEWGNFMALRAHPAAEIHIADVAEKMLIELNKSAPKLLKAGEWHVPFGDKIDKIRVAQLHHKLYPTDNAQVFDFSDLYIKIATARCARVSYLNYEGTDNYEKDIKLHDRLVTMHHSSPFEHCAQAMPSSDVKPRLLSRWSGNFKGFVQYRKMFEGENQNDGRITNKTK